MAQQGSQAIAPFVRCELCSPGEPCSATLGCAADLFDPPHQDEKDRGSLERLDYYEYLESVRWRHVRQLALEHYGGCCVLCGSRVGINVHHRTYKTIGHERLQDLIPLCRRHHAEIHKVRA